MDELMKKKRPTLRQSAASKMLPVVTPALMAVCTLTTT
jgi:hypothetical protein